MFFKSKKIRCGVDLGFNSIKVVSVSTKKSNGSDLVLESLGLTVSPARFETKYLIDKLNIAWKYLKIPTRSAVGGIGGKSAIIKRMKLSAPNKEALYKMSILEAAKFFPKSTGELQSQVLVLNEEAAPIYDVLLVATKVETIEFICGIFAGAKLTLAAIDLNALALVHSFRFNYPEVKNKTVALLDIGATDASLVIVRDGEPLLTREMPFGGSQISDIFAKVLEKTAQEGEKFKMNLDANLKKEMLASEVHERITYWVKEIDVLLNVYSATELHDQVSAFYISGGGSLLPSLDTKLSEALSLPVLWHNPLKNIIVSDKKFDPEYINYIAPQMAVATGLAIYDLK